MGNSIRLNSILDPHDYFSIQPPFAASGFDRRASRLRHANDLWSRRLLCVAQRQTGLAWVDIIAAQFKHPAWNGFTFYDFIFPLFLFISGVSLAFSLNSAQAKGVENRVLYLKAFKRMLILIGLGILYKNAPVSFFEPSQIRFVSVLGRIGFAGFITTLIYLNFGPRGRIGWIASILLLYYAALYLVPVSGYGAGDLSFEGNLVGWFDRTFCRDDSFKKPTTNWACLLNFQHSALAYWECLVEKFYAMNKAANKY